MRLGRTTVIHFSAQVVITVSGFVGTFVIAYLLNADGLGRYAVAVALGYFWLAIPAQAVSSALTKRMSEGQQPGEYLSAGFLLNGVLGLVLGALVFVVGEALGALLQPTNPFVAVLSRYNQMLALLLIGTIGYRSVLAGLIGQKKVAQQGLLQAAERAARTTLQVVLMFLGYGVAGLLIGHTVSLVAACVGGILLYAVRPARPDWSHVRGIVSFARYAWLGTLQDRTFGWLDTIVLSFFVNTSLIGIYEAAWGLASMLGMVNTSIRNTLFPEFSELSTEENFQRIQHYLNEGMVFSGVFVIPGLFGAVIIGQRVLRFYRPTFERGAVILILLVFAYVAHVYGSQFVSLFDAIDRPDIAFRANRLFIGLNIVLNVVLVWRFGWHGAAVATVLSTLVWTAFSYRALFEYITPTVPGREILLEVVASAVMAGVVVPVKPLPPNNRFGTVLLVSFGAAVYFAVLLAISGRIRRKALSLLPAPLRSAVP